jgi:MFS family permease
VNNLNDGMAWGLFPLFFAAARMDLGQIGTLAAIYPATWGVAQLFTGAWSDRVGRKWLIAWGMCAGGGTVASCMVLRLSSGCCWAWHGDGVPDAAGSHRRRGASALAGVGGRGVSAVARCRLAAGAGLIADALDAGSHAVGALL